MLKHRTHGAAALAAAAWLVMGGPAAAEKNDWRPDSWVTAKVKLALATSAEATASDVNVDTTDGRVTLHGKVDSEKAKTAAAEEARTVDGVRSVDNLLQVVPPEQRALVAKADDQIAASTSEALENEESLDDSDIEVTSVNGGVVLLGGSASDLEDRVVAVRTARAVPGVKAVQTNIEGPDRVAAPGLADKSAAALADAGEKAQAAASRGAAATAEASDSVVKSISDAWITTKVKSALIATEDVPALQINVDTADRVVTLFGKVDTAAAKRRAEEAALDVDNVATVNNQLEVVPSQDAENVAVTDAAIHEHIAKELAARKQFSQSDIDVEVSDGVVRLTGETPNTDVRESAAVIARSVGGVRAVRNELNVES